LAVVDLTEAAKGREELLTRVRELAETDPLACYQCGKCSAGCPLSFAMDYQPRQIIRLVQLGMREQALGSSTIWLCAGCATCTTRCPRQVKIDGVMDALRQLAGQDGRAPREREVAAFHTSFLESVRRGGRVHELGMVGSYKLRTRRIFQDGGLGWNLLRHRRLPLKASPLRDRKTVERIFRAAEVRG
jgi:heterodisulfide reductase subunit C